MGIRDCRVLLLEGLHANAAALFTGAGFTHIRQETAALEGEALLRALHEADIVGIRSRTQLTAEILAEAKHIKTIGCYCIGTNQVDVDKAAELGIPVFNAPFSNTRSVAELVIAQIISLLRGMTDKSHRVHTGTWPKRAKGSFEARGKTLGIIGYGNIGAQLSVLAEGLGMRVIYYDVQTKLPLGNAEPVLSMDDLLARADAVSLHVPQLPSTKDLISARELALMKPGSVLINAARGHCVNIADLANALRSGHLIGAALDVFPEEPANTDEALDCELRGMDNVILTPHIGGSTEEAQANIGLEVSEKLLAYLLNGTTGGAVNFPEVTMPRQPGTHRLVHIHHNRPGVLSAINQLFAEKNINISAQTLMTRGDIGYLLMDIDGSTSKVALEHIRQVDGTVRVRLLLD